ncbi:lipase maturation factor family protein [Halocalculus aciditolerans]|uniref:Membrane protein n=1 Tax=Halocalculus aciditolerans TaxID=1383812 RepID=A0A830FGQ2_9EURY|nr:lipase maturation factor family protein [Halocalculus aciditolerans]GGL51152.1 membrane protein [Halocalculus aciditolerans]
MQSWGANDWLVRFLLQRGLAVVYLLAFLVAARQFRPLAGEDGLLPLGDYADRASVTESPSLFVLVPDDRLVGLAAWTGVALSVVALLAGPYWLPAPYAVPAAMALWAALWLLYLSFVNAGRVFYGYGWESMLLETGFLAVFLGAGPTAPPEFVLWLVRWLLFRNMFGAGLIKLRGDDAWRDLTAMDFHYETQPMPNAGSWFAHHLPDRFHRAEVLGNHVVELAIPFLYFAPQPYASLAALATIGFQAWLMGTGNFAWLNFLTMIQSIALFSDDTLAVALPVDAIRAALGVPTGTPAPTPTFLLVLAVALVVLVLALSVRPALNLLSRDQYMNTSFDPLRLVNTYGAFGSITRARYGLVVEGTNAENPGEGDWREYEFRGQPVKTDERPRQWAPFHLRLDWQLWFAAMRSRPGPRERWLTPFLDRLLDGDERVHRLLRDTPFPADDPPEQIRIIRYRYRFTTPEERAETGDWWRRERLDTYVPATSDPGRRTRRRFR